MMNYFVDVTRVPPAIYTCKDVESPRTYRKYSKMLWDPILPMKSVTYQA